MNEKNMPPQIFSYKNCFIKIERTVHYRGLRIIIEPNGTIRLKTPSGIQNNQIQKFLNTNEDWLASTYMKNQMRLQKFNLTTAFDGQIFLFLGINRKLKIQKSRRNSVYVFGPSLVVETDNDSQKSVLKQIRHFYKTEAEKVISEVLRVRIQELGLCPQKVIYRNNSSRWGSCNSKGVISFNWKLISAPVRTIDYVVVHELTHLVHHNHSLQFWENVEKTIPNFKVYEDWLKKHHFDLEFLNEVPQLFCCPI